VDAFQKHLSETKIEHAGSSLVFDKCFAKHLFKMKIEPASSILVLVDIFKKTSNKNEN
jgi:hypothetical protein